MNLLITGGCGFIGSNFINYYHNKYPNSSIVCLDNMYYCASITNINEYIRSSSNFTFIKGNICDYNLVYDTLVKYNITHVVHFAAQSHVDNSFHQSFQYTQDNVIGTHTILEAIKDINNNINKDILLLHFSTDEVYGESLNNEIKSEQSILCPTNPYSASKAAAEMYVYSYIYSFKIKAIITRCNNVYGDNQYPEKLIPKFIKLLKENKKCTIAGDGSAIRNFIHVYDVCTAVDIILEKGIIGEVYNIGGNHSNEYSVIDVAKKLIKLIKPNININYNDYIEYIQDRPFNDTRYFISNNKLIELGWIQTINFDDGLLSLL
jgi:dTDP-glucose 4,6-dehydratase